MFIEKNIVTIQQFSIFGLFNENFKEHEVFDIRNHISRWSDRVQKKLKMCCNYQIKEGSIQKLDSKQLYISDMKKTYNKIIKKHLIFGSF